MEKRLEHFAFLCNQLLNYKDLHETGIKELANDMLKQNLIGIRNNLLYLQNVQAIITNIESEIKKCYEVKK